MRSPYVFLQGLLATACLLALGVAAQTRFPGGEGSRTLDTSGHPKAKGVSLKIDFPASWSIEEARRPNTVAIAVSQSGRGLENCVLTIHTMEQVGWSKAKFAAETPRTFAAPERLRRAAEDIGGALLGGGPANIEGLTSRWLEVMPDVSRDGRSYVPTLLYQILYKERMIVLGCVTGSEDREEALVRFKRFSESTFRLVANSILIPDRWR